MLTEDDEPRPKYRLAPLPLDQLSVAELQAYVAELAAEIARAEAAISRKQSHRNAADSVFKR